MYCVLVLCISLIIGSMNHIKYNERWTFVKSVVLQKFGFDVSFHPSNSFPYGELFVTSNI